MTRATSQTGSQNSPAPAAADVRVELVSNPAYLCAMREMVGVICKRTGFVDAVASKVVLAVDEALANVMNHGYERRQDGRIWISIFRETDALTGKVNGLRIVMEDEGRQVDPCLIKSRNLDDIRPGGLGVHIIKEVMDVVIYERREGRGMRLTLSKRLPAENEQQQLTPGGPCG